MTSPESTQKQRPVREELQTPRNVGMLAPTLEDALVQLAQDDFAVRQDKRHEYGRVLFAKDGRLSPSDLITSGSPGAVHLYPQATMLRVVETLAPDAAERYIGDYHTHPVGEAWMSQFPSPEDVTCQSVLCDLWPIVGDDPALPGMLPIAPSLQVVQSLLFGDCFLLKAVDGREKFTNVHTQQVVLRDIQLEFAGVMDHCNERYLGVPRVVSHGEFLDVVADVLPKLRATLASRATIELRMNEGAPDRWTRPIQGDHGASANARVPRNAPCPCGSGKKYKRCCGVA